MNTKLIASSAVILLGLGAAPAWSFDIKSDWVITQPANEIAAQKVLPTVHDETWTKLIKCAVDYDDKKGTYSIHLTPEVKALDGKTITMRGFMLPMDGSDHTRHFLLSRNTPVCLYCPPGEPNEVVEVKTNRAVAWTNKIVSVTGKLKLINDEEKALFFTMENGEAK
jgi:hypothetical protein